MMPTIVDADKVIAEVEKYPVLYDVAHEKYRNPDYKEGIWKKIAKDLGYHGASGMAACKTKWTHVRDQFRKTLRKRKLGAGTTFIRKYKYEDLLQFLVPHLAERDGVPLQDFDDDVDDDENENGCSTNDQELWNPGLLKIEHDTDSVSSVSKTQQISADVIQQASRKRKASVSSDCPSNNEMFAHLFGKYGKRKNRLQEDQHPMDAFLAGISPTLKSFNPVQQNKAKSKIFAIVQEMELEHLASVGIAET